MLTRRLLLWGREERRLQDCLRNYRRSGENYSVLHPTVNDYENKLSKLRFDFDT
jgi:hypothetical protein